MGHLTFCLKVYLKPIKTSASTNKTKKKMPILLMKDKI